MKSARFHSGAVAGSDAYDAAAEGSDAAACRDSQVVARPPHPRDRGSAIPGAGVSWGALQSFCEAHQADLQGRSTRQVRDLIKSLTTFRRCSYADYLDNPVSESESETVGPATVFVSHAWSRPFLELIDCIGNWLGQQDHKARVRQRFWLDLMVVSQHLDDPSEADAQVAAENFSIFSGGFQCRLQAIGVAIFVLSPRDEPTWMSRVWCLFEFFMAVSLRLRFEFVVPQSQNTRFIEWLGAGECRSLEIVSKLDMEKAEASSKFDETQIKAVVRGETGGFSKVNEAIIGGIREFCITTSMTALSAMSEDEKSSNQLLENTADLLDVLGDPNAALGCLAESLSIKGARLGTEDKSLGKTYSLLGAVHRKLGNLEESLKFHQKSLDIHTRCFGAGHVSVADTHLNIGVVHRHQANYDKAMLHYNLALSVYKPALGEAHMSVANTYHNMGVVENNLGNLQKALDFYQKALGIAQTCLGLDHVSCADSLTCIRNVHQKLGNNEDALLHHSQALKIYEKSLGSCHVSVADTKNNIALVLEQQGKLREALKLYQEALETTIRAVGPSHTSVAGTKNNIGEVYRQLGRYDEAMKSYSEALEINEKCLGSLQAGAAYNYNNMALVQEMLGNFDESLKLHSTALDIKARCFGTGHVSVAATYSNMGTSNWRLETSRKL